MHFLMTALAHSLMQLLRGDVEWDGRKLRSDRHCRHRGDTDVVQHAEQPAPQKPEHAERALKNAIARGAAGLGYHAGDCGFEDGFLRAHADTPERDADQQHRHAVRAEDEDGKRRGQERGPHERAHALFIVHHAENKRCDRVDEHRACIEERQRTAADERGRFGKAGGKLRIGARDVHDDDGIVDEAEGKEADARDVEHEFLFHPEGHIFLRLGLKMLGIRELHAREEQQQDRDRPRNGKHGKAAGINRKGRAVGLKEHHEIEQYRARERTDLVEHLLNTEAPSHALLRGGKGHDRVLRGLLDGLAHALDDEKSAGPHPAVLADERQRGDGQDIEKIAEDRHRPVPLRLVREFSEDVAHRVAHELAEAGHKADHARARPQKGKIRPADAGCTLVRHVGKQAHDAKKHDKGHRLRPFLFFLLHLCSSSP